MCSYVYTEACNLSKTITGQYNRVYSHSESTAGKKL